MEHPRLLPFYGQRTLPQHTVLVSPWMEFSLHKYVTESNFYDPQMHKMKLVRPQICYPSCLLISAQIIGIIRGLAYIHDLHRAHGDFHWVSA